MKISVHLSIGYCNADYEDELEIPDEELEGLTEEEKREHLDECAEQWANNYIEIYWEPIKEG